MCGVPSCMPMSLCVLNVLHFCPHKFPNSGIIKYTLTFYPEAYLIKKRISEGIVGIVVVWETSRNLKGNSWALKFNENNSAIINTSYCMIKYKQKSNENPGKYDFTIHWNSLFFMYSLEQNWRCLECANICPVNTCRCE